MSVSTDPMAIEMFDGLLERLGNIPPHRICLTVPPGKATEKDVIRLQDRTNRNFELVEGTLVEKPVGQIESYITMNLGGFLWTFLRSYPLGYLTGPDGGMRLLPQLVRMPDIAFISWDQVTARQPNAEKVAPFAPALAVEVLSASNTRKEMERKRKEYFLGGTRLVWIVDPPTRTIEVWTSPDDCVTLTEEQTLDGGDVLPGFQVTLREVFANLPRLPAHRGKKKPRRA